MRQLRRDVDELKGSSRETKLLLRICTGCSVILAGVLVTSVPAWITDHKTVQDHSEAIAYMRPRIDLAYWTLFPVPAKKSEGL